MPQLFVLPRQVPLSSAASLLAGCKLTFSATGSSTLQNTYSDIALTTPNANPVIADGNGVFGKIYLDPSLPHYRVKLTTSADVLIYQEDDVPSNQNTAQQFRLQYTTPSLIFQETDASADNGRWVMKANGEKFILSLLDDSEAVETQVLEITRIGSFVNALNFAGQYLKVNGDFVATQTSGSFTATLTGMTVATTGTVKWYRTGTKVGLFVPSQIAGTSNTTDMTMTGVPTALLMSTNKPYVPCAVRDNGVSQLGFAQIQRSLGDTSSIVFSVGTTVGAVFTGSGSKGLPGGTYIQYDSDGVDIA